jgi:hypothetical protein
MVVKKYLKTVTQNYINATSLICRDEICVYYSGYFEGFLVVSLFRKVKRPWNGQAENRGSISGGSSGFLLITASRHDLGSTQHRI